MTKADGVRRMKRATVIVTPTGPAVFLTNAGIQHCQSIEAADALADAVNRFDVFYEIGRATMTAKLAVKESR